MDKLPDLADCQRTLWTRSSAEIVGDARRLYSFRKRVEVVFDEGRAQIMSYFALCYAYQNLVKEETLGNRFAPYRDCLSLW